MNNEQARNEWNNAVDSILDAARDPKNHKMVREFFGVLIAHTEDKDRIAQLELAREYHTNPAFAKALSDYIFDRTYDSATA